MLTRRWRRRRGRRLWGGGEGRPRPWQRALDLRVWWI
uniref:Uncharacterized protein n=1 Tax=Arundo donax TaxID=35708 RepID=A0A0A9HLH9_ARUDO